MKLTPQPQSVDLFVAMPTSELLPRFAFGIEHFDRQVVKLTDDQLDMAFLPDAGCGNWPIRILLGHLADAELAFVHRMRRVVAEERPMLQPWDENAFIDSAMYGNENTPAGRRQSIGAFIATVHTLRRWTADWLRTLDDSAFKRSGMHMERGEQTLHTILAYDTWHLEHHARFLNAKVAKFTR